MAERVRRLEDAGIVTGYRAVMDPARLGLGLTVFMRIQTPPGNYPKFNQLVIGLREFLEFHRMTGSEAFLMKAAVSSIAPEIAVGEAEYARADYYLDCPVVAVDQPRVHSS